MTLPTLVDLEEIPLLLDGGALFAGMTWAWLRLKGSPAALRARDGLMLLRSSGIDVTRLIVRAGCGPG